MKLLCDLFGEFYEAWYSPDRSWSGYLSQDSSRHSLQIFYILYYIVQSDWCLIFGILNYRSSLLLCSGLSGFPLSSVFWLILGRLSSMQIYTAGSAEDDYYSVDLRALPIVLHILIGINSTHVPFVFNLPLIEIARTQFFVRWMDCNTPLPEYVLSCVFRFFDRIFRFTFCTYFVLWIIYVIVLSWIGIPGLGVSPSLNRRPDPSVLLNLVFPVFWFDRFLFQISFSNIIYFIWFSGIFLN